MRGAECASCFVPQQGVVTETVNSVSQVGDIGGVSGDVGGVGRHVVVGGFELGAVNGVSAAGSQVASGDVGDLAGGVSAVRGAECASCFVPQQGVVTETVNSVSQVGDIGGVSGDVGGVGRHVVVGGFELGAVNGVSAAGSQVASGDVGDLAGGVSAVRGAECASCFVPQQGVVTETVNSVSQVGDIGGVSGDVGGVGRHVVVGGFELRAVNGVSAAGSQVASGDVSDFAGGFGAVCGTECCAVPQQSILLQVVQLRAVYYIGAGCRNRTFSNISDFVGGICTVIGAERPRGFIPL